jgi:hypothetical protein
MKESAITRLKCVVVSAFVSVVFVSQASAVFRPPFPIKSTPPSNGDVTVIGDELVQRPAAKKTLPNHRR